MSRTRHTEQQRLAMRRALFNLEKINPGEPVKPALQIMSAFEIVQAVAARESDPLARSARTLLSNVLPAQGATA